MEDYEWSCFSAQQAAEKSVKALYQSLRAAARGDSVSGLLSKLPRRYKVAEQILAKAKGLDRHYIPARYPNAHPEGTPSDYYGREDAEEAVKDAEEIIEFCEGIVRSVQRKSRQGSKKIRREA